MSDLSHLRLENTGEPLPYTYAGGSRGGLFALPRRDRMPHANKLRQEILTARSEIDDVRLLPPENKEIDGYQLTLRSDPDFELKLESLERLREGMELLSVRREDNVTVATVFGNHRSGSTGEIRPERRVECPTNTHSRLHIPPAPNWLPLPDTAALAATESLRYHRAIRSVNSQPFTAPTQLHIVNSPPGYHRCSGRAMTNEQ